MSVVFQNSVAGEVDRGDETVGARRSRGDGDRVLRGLTGRADGRDGGDDRAVGVAASGECRETGGDEGCCGDTAKRDAAACGLDATNVRSECKTAPARLLFRITL